MDQFWLDIAFETSKRQNCRKCRKRRQPTTTEWDAMDYETFGFNRGPSLINASRDMNFIACLACSTGHRQSIEQECEILVDDV